MGNSPQEIAARLTQEEKEALLNGNYDWYEDDYDLIDCDEVFDSATGDEFRFFSLNELGREVLAILEGDNG